MKLIIEHVEDVKYLIEEVNGKKNLYIEGIYMQGDIPNRNRRKYPIDTLVNETARYNKDFVVKNRAFGELGHPAGPMINLDRVSHRITELKVDGNNILGKAMILDTPMGNIARGIIESGGQLGVSSRGTGTLKEVNGVNVVQNDFMLATPADIVADPSAPDAFVNGIMENVEWIWADNGLLTAHRVIEETKQEIEEAVISRSLDQDEKLAIFERFLSKLGST